MALRFRISLSLAAKCRLGFAFAVLLIITAGFIVPYRWMDKLVEQGRVELAQAEVRHVLKRHFQNIDPDSMAGQSPPLSIDQKQTPRNQTRWIDLPDLDWADKETIRQYYEEAFPDDKFIRKGINHFRTHENEEDMFVLQMPATLDPDSDPNEIDSFLDRLTQSLPWDKPSRYLFAVRSDSSCTAEGCHPVRVTIAENREQPNDDTPPAFIEGELVGVIDVKMPAGQTSVTLLFNRMFIIMGGLISATCAIITFYLITQRFILQPVRSLREAADKVSAEISDNDDADSRQDIVWENALEITEQVKTGDEYEKMAVAFHQMLSRLKTAHDRLRATNLALDMKLGELENKNVALYESNKLKSEFLANVSHELRTPLNAILGFAEILKEQAENREDDKGVRYVGNVLDAGKHLLRIINELLDLAKIEAGKVQVNLASCSLRDIIEILTNLMRPLADKKKLKINCRISQAIPIIETDPDKLQQVLFNLFDNAVKFTPEGGTVSILAFPMEHDTIDLESNDAHKVSGQTSPTAEPIDHVVVQIADTGPGISHEDRDKIFEKFRQLDGSVTRTHAGAGLGLAIVKELVQRINGQIEVNDNHPHGAIFTLTLPVRQLFTQENDRTAHTQEDEA